MSHPSDLNVDTDDGLLVLRSRPPVPGDRPYVASTMLDAVRRSDTHRRLRHSEWDREADALMELWDDGPRSAPLRATVHLPEDPGLIVAYVLADPSVPLVHHLHVRPPFRHLGLVRPLLMHVGIDPDGPIAVSHDTRDLSRPVPTDNFPVGLLHNGNWRLTLVGREGRSR